ncbi:MAG: SUMF1/EgtB/PvdO family nonheme iron enzyme [Waddliaceae bacterium]
MKNSNPIRSRDFSGQTFISGCAMTQSIALIIFLFSFVLPNRTFTEDLIILNDNQKQKRNIVSIPSLQYPFGVLPLGVDKVSLIRVIPDESGDQMELITTSGDLFWAKISEEPFLAQSDDGNNESLYTKDLRLLSLNLQERGQASSSFQVDLNNGFRLSGECNEDNLAFRDASGHIAKYSPSQFMEAEVFETVSIKIMEDGETATLEEYSPMKEEVEISVPQADQTFRIPWKMIKRITRRPNKHANVNRVAKQTIDATGSVENIQEAQKVGLIAPPSKTAVPLKVSYVQFEEVDDQEEESDSDEKEKFELLSIDEEFGHINSEETPPIELDFLELNDEFYSAIEDMDLSALDEASGDEKEDEYSFLSKNVKERDDHFAAIEDMDLSALDEASDDEKEEEYSFLSKREEGKVDALAAIEDMDLSALDEASGDVKEEEYSFLSKREEERDDHFAAIEDMDLSALDEASDDVKEEEYSFLSKNVKERDDHFAAIEDMDLSALDEASGDEKEEEYSFVSRKAATEKESIEVCSSLKTEIKKNEVEKEKGGSGEKSCINVAAIKERKEECDGSISYLSDKRPRSEHKKAYGRFEEHATKPGLRYIIPVSHKTEGYYLQSKKVTNLEYYGFMRAIGYPAPSQWTNGSFPEGEDDAPVTNVSYVDAYLYTVWKRQRLPTREELLCAGVIDGALEDTCDGLFEWTSTIDTDFESHHRRLDSSSIRDPGHIAVELRDRSSKVLQNNARDRKVGFRCAL